MYYPANDNELIYLIKDGNTVAHRVLYLKYAHLITKLYKVSPYGSRIHYADFQQECLLCLEKAIYLYKEKFCCSFYTFFRLVASRKIRNLLRTDCICLKERNTEYTTVQSLDERAYSSNATSFKHIPVQDALEKDFLEECILGNIPLSIIARKHNLEYPLAYYRYKKFKEKLEKLLTNDSV